MRSVEKRAAVCCAIARVSQGALAPRYANTAPASAVVASSAASSSSATAEPASVHDLASRYHCRGYGCQCCGSPPCALPAAERLSQRSLLTKRALSRTSTVPLHSRQGPMLVLMSQTHASRRPWQSARCLQIHLGHLWEIEQYNGSWSTDLSKVQAQAKTLWARTTGEA